MRLLQLFESQSRTVAFCFGRMNPPTIGHQKLVDAVLKQKADAHFLFVSQTQKSTGKNKIRFANPLPFDVKLGFIQQAFPNIEIGSTTATTIIGVLQDLEKQGFENVIFVGGSDRIDAFNDLLNKQNGIDYQFKSINVVSSGSRDPDAEGAEGMSASKMRDAAISNDLKSFKTGLPAGLHGSAEEVFSAVRQGLSPWINEDGAAGGAGAGAGGGAGGDAAGVGIITKQNSTKDVNKGSIRKNLKAWGLTNKKVSEAPIEMDPADPMDPMIHSHDKANPAKLKYRMLRAMNQLKDLAARAENASPNEWQMITRDFKELTMNIEQIRHALEELSKIRSKGGIKSRGITI